MNGQASGSPPRVEFKCRYGPRARLSPSRIQVVDPREPVTAQALWAGANGIGRSYVTRPTMTLYRPKGRNNGTAMLVMPGGGFEIIATDLEGTEICDWVVRMGMTCAVLKYRVPQKWPQENGRQQRPKVLLGLQDAQRAIGLLRQRASSYGIDPHKIGVIGFSAGAYLAAAMSNTEERTYPLADAADRQSPRPAFGSSPTRRACWTIVKAGTVSNSNLGDHQSKGTANVDPSCDERSHRRDPGADGLRLGAR